MKKVLIIAVTIVAVIALGNVRARVGAGAAISPVSRMRRVR